MQALNYCLWRFAADPHSWNPMWIRRNPSVVLVLANEEKKLGDDIEGTMVQDNRVAVGADAGHFVSISGWWIRWWTKWTSQASRRQKFWQDRFSFCCLMWCKFATFISIRYRTALTTAARFLGDSGLNVVENLLATGGASRICFAACRSKRSSVSDWRARRSTSWSPIKR